MKISQIAKVNYNIIIVISLLLLTLSILSITTIARSTLSNDIDATFKEVPKLDIQKLIKHDSIFRTIDQDTISEIRVPFKDSSILIFHVQDNLFCGTAGCVYKIFKEETDNLTAIGEIYGPEGLRYVTCQDHLILFYQSIKKQQWLIDQSFTLINQKNADKQELCKE